MGEDSPLVRLLEQLAEPFTAEALFDQMPETVFFIKNAEGQYICVNDTLVIRSGQRNKSQLLGRTPSEVFGEELGRSYEAQDREVLRSGRQLLGKLELHVYRQRKTGWCLTNKLPLRGLNGQVVGLVGVSRDLAAPDLKDWDFGQIAATLAHAKSRLEGPPSVKEMAAAASLSGYQLDRRMKRLFGLSAGQWLLKERIGHACQELIETRLPIAQIALDCGYADQSAFTRQFRRTTGCTPSEFRSLGAL
ncbi:MAG: AraC family transcriptional regulator [Deltaproteobacteria bacterium]|nr:AraC family transcriptional regulator [Deltaproteobacteria bacterium]